MKSSHSDRLLLSPRPAWEWKKIWIGVYTTGAPFRLVYQTELMQMELCQRTNACNNAIAVFSPCPPPTEQPHRCPFSRFRFTIQFCWRARNTDVMSRIATKVQTAFRYRHCLVSNVSMWKRERRSRCTSTQPWQSCPSLIWTAAAARWKGISSSGLVWLRQPSLEWGLQNQRCLSASFF